MADRDRPSLDKPVQTQPFPDCADETRRTFSRLAVPSRDVTYQPRLPSPAARCRSGRRDAPHCTAFLDCRCSTRTTARDRDYHDCRLLLRDVPRSAIPRRALTERDDRDCRTSSRTDLPDGTGRKPAHHDCLLLLLQDCPTEPYASNPRLDCVAPPGAAKTALDFRDCQDAPLDAMRSRSRTNHDCHTVPGQPFADSTPTTARLLHLDRPHLDFRCPDRRRQDCRAWDRLD